MKHDVVVVGAGPAGMMAAVEAAGSGCRVTLVDEAHRPGGQIYRPAWSEGPDDHGIGNDAERARGRALFAAFAAARERIDYRAGASAFALFPGPELHVEQGGATEVMRAGAVVLATGVIERAIPFPGWTLPGVMYAGGVQAVLKSHGVRAGDRVVVSGTGPLPIAVAAQLVESGARLAVLALLHPVARMLRHPLALWAGRSAVREGRAYLDVLRRANVEVLEGFAVTRAHDDRNRLARVTIKRCDRAGFPVTASARSIECDLLALNYGFTANAELAAMAGAELRYDRIRGGWLPVADAFGRTSVAGVLVAGDAAGLRGPFVATPEGRIVGAAAAAVARHEDVEAVRARLAPAFAERRRHADFQAAIRETLALPPGVWSWADDETVVCRCECVTRARLVEAIREGHATLNAVKRVTRAGMGWCGGRGCMQSVAAIVGRGRSDAATGPVTPRPLSRPVRLSALATVAHTDKGDN